MKPDIEFEMQLLEDCIKNLEYDITQACADRKGYSEIRGLVKDKLQAIIRLDWLKLEPCLPD